METLFNSGRTNFSLANIIVTLFLLAGGMTSFASNPSGVVQFVNIPDSKPWMVCWEGESVQEAPLAIACRPNINLSLNQEGFAVLTPLELVLDPQYFPWMYTVDIMGPLNDTVFCTQLGQSVQVVVTDPTGNSCMSTVLVEDKLKPTLFCTPDEVPCNVDIPTLDFESFLDGVEDNCDTDLDLYYSYVIQNLPCNANGYTQQVSVTWTATDNYGNSTSCVDIIYLKKPSLGQIVFPDDVTMDCVGADIDPSNTGEPTFNGEPIGVACQIIVFHTDQVVPMCNGSQKILRLWTVKDWCNSGQRTDVQEILIIDNIPPVLTCPANLTLNTSPGVCSTNYVLPTPVVTDQCSNGAIDVVIMVPGQGSFQPGDVVPLQLGTTTITIKATDECNNTATCHYTVTVKDLTPPIPICHSVVVSIGADGMGFIIAANLDFPITENCGILSKEVFRMTNTCNTPEDLVPNPEVKFCCADVGQTIMVGFKVTDLSGNMNTCMFQATIVDELPPVAECKDITVSIDGNGNLVITPEQVNDGSTDNCTIIDLDVTPNTFTCEDVGENVVVLTVTDQSGNTATCTATVTITDFVPPVAVCQDITVNLDDNGNVTITTGQINNGSTDNCAIDTMFLNNYDFDCDDEGEINIVTLTVTDFGGNTSTCTATVTVLSNPPVALCQDITVSLNEDGTVTIEADDVNNGSTDDCGIDTITVTPGVFDCDDIGENVVVLTVTDISDNVSTCTATVTVEDNMPPLAICQDITVMLDDMGNATITAAQIDGGSSDNCGNITLSVTPSMFTCDDVGDNVVVLTVTDEAGNTSTCIAIVMIDMPDPPMAICQDITITLGPDGTFTIDPLMIDDGSTAQCGDLTYELDIDSFDCSDVGEVNIVTLTVTDETGASATCTATVTVNEGPPVAICQDVTISLDENGNGTVTASQVDNNSTDDCGIEFYEVTPFLFDCDNLGENVVTLTVTDSSGLTSTCTAIVTVEDNLPPVALCQDITVAIGAGGTVVIEAIDIDNGSSDNCDTDLSLTVTPNSFDCEDLGEQIVTLTVTDDSGNQSTCTASVTIVAEPPTAVCQDITVSLGPDGIRVIVPEEVDGGSTGDCGETTLTLDEDTFDCDEIGDNIVILTVTDEGGATSTCTATVTVVDDLDPICSAQDITVFLDENGEVTITASQVDNGSTDNCPPVLLGVTPASFNCEDVGDNFIVLTVMDMAGNSSTCTAIVTVVDTIAPLCATVDITVSVNGSMVTILPEDIDNGSSDLCGPITLDVDPETFDCDDLGPNVVTLTVTDESGNTSTCTAVVTVTDDGGLVANCQNITIFLDANGNASIDPSDIDNGSGGGCAGGDLEFDLSQTDFDCTDIGPNIVTLTVTDEQGNTAVCTATVTVVDNMPPTIQCPPHLTLACTDVDDPNMTGQFGNATGDDNCPPVVITETHVLNLNDCGVGTILRTFTATDNSGNIATCTQMITISSSDPFGEDDITWPPSPLSVNICNSTQPPATGQPTFNPQSLDCANPMATFTDQVQTFVDNDPNTVCRIITRTWTVTDNCQPNGTFVFVQTINVQDMVPPVFTNINDMTKVANSDCVANFTLIASATDCAGVTITNNSPYGQGSGANASGNYPIGVTTVIFTATDGCGNISTMDVVITVTDPDPTEFLCDKQIIFLPPETEVAINARTFITFIPGTCSDGDDYIISYSRTNPFDTVRIYDCGDVGVTTFSLYFWNVTGSMLVDSCDNADLDLRDPDDFCQDGLIIAGEVLSEYDEAVREIEVNIVNIQMNPGMTDDNGQYIIEGLEKSTGYKVAPFHDKDHKKGVSTLDLVLIQKHLLGRAKLNSPYKMIAADANKSNSITAVDLLEIRKLILGIQDRFTSNTSWRFVDRAYQFPNSYNPFDQPFAESVWVDSVTLGIDTINFVGVKIGDVNGSYFQSLQQDPVIKTRSAGVILIEERASVNDKSAMREFFIADHQESINGLQTSIYVGGLTDEQLKSVTSDILTPDQWYYDINTGELRISWSVADAENLSGQLLIGFEAGEVSEQATLENGSIRAEAYNADEDEVALFGIKLQTIQLSGVVPAEYHLFQNRPNPFADGTTITFIIPQDEKVRLAVFDVSGKLVYEHAAEFKAGKHDIQIKGSDLSQAGLYYYTLYTTNATFTRKMTLTSNQLF